MKTSEPTIPARIASWIRADGGDLALLLITLDAEQRPHVVMLARDEIHVASPALLRIAVSERSRSAENLRLRRAATLAIYDHGLACIIKARAATGPRLLLKGTVFCDLAVEDVRFDTPAAEEGEARLVSGLRFEGRAERHEVRQALARLD